MNADFLFNYLAMGGGHISCSKLLVKFFVVYLFLFFLEIHKWEEEIHANRGVDPRYSRAVSI